MTSADIFVAVLALIGGAAVGGAAGGGLMGALQWSGGRLRAAIGTSAVVGATVGFMVTGGVPMPSLAALLPRLGGPSDAEEIQRVMKTYYPADYQSAVAEQQTLAATGASKDQVVAAMRQIALPLMQRQMPYASTDNAMAELDVVRDEQAFLMSRPDLCYRLLAQPSPQTLSELQTVLPDDLRERDAKLMIKMLEQTATAPQAPHPPASMDSDLTIWARDAFDGLSFDDRDALTKGGADHDKAACEMYGNMLRIIAFSGPTEAGEALKAITVKGLQRMQS
jgi:hypothetical protein